MMCHLEEKLLTKSLEVLKLQPYGNLCVVQVIQGASVSWPRQAWHILAAMPCYRWLRSLFAIS